MSIEIKPVGAVTEEMHVHYSFLDVIYDAVFERPVSRWTVLLPGSGCSWARKKHKGCSFCAFNSRIDEVTGGRLIPHDEMMAFFGQAENLVKNSEPDLLALFNGGNFINDLEIVPTAQLAILEAAARHPTISTVLFESKTEYLSSRKLDACAKAIGPKKIRIAIGLECKDDYLRNTIINKGMSKEAYVRAIRRLHERGMQVQSYVFMKPFSITEKHAIQEAVDSIEYAVDCGSDIVMLEAAMVQKGTAFETAYNKGEFDSPWLWSIREVVEKTRHLKPLNVGIFDEEPKPISYPRNCPACTESFNRAFHIFREIHDDAPLLSLDCQCKKTWKTALACDTIQPVAH